MRPTPHHSGASRARRAGPAGGTPDARDPEAAARVLAALVGEAPVGVIELDAAGDCVTVNRTWAGMAGLSPERAAGTGWLRAVHPSDRGAARADVLRAVREGGRVHSEYRLRTAAGRVRWVEARAVPVPDGRGGVQGFVGTVVDITDRKNREAELAAIAEHAPDAVLRLDRNRRAVFANAAQARWSGIPAASYPGRTLWELALPEDLVVALDGAVERAMASGIDADLEFEAPTPDGPRWLHSRVVPERGPDGAADHVLLVSRDVTRRREAEEVLRASDAMKSALVRGVSHEFRAPLAAISAAAGALERVAEPARRAELLGMVADETGRLERLVTNLLDLSRLEGGALVPRLDWCAVDDLVTGARRGAGVGLAPGGLAVDLDPAHPLVQADQVLTERILANLLRNAVNHGAPPVRISSRAADGRLCITVQDAGPGLPAALADAAFEPFVQGEGRPGIGIGLALSRGFAEAQGGTLHAERPGEPGARFVLSLPLLPVPEVPE